MSEDRPHHEGLEARIYDLIAPSLAAMGYETVRVRLAGRERPTLQVMVERADGFPITLDDCETVSHQVSALLDVEDPIPSAYTLEVSSPGIDRPLTRAKDWNRFAGHLAKVELAMPVAGRRRLSGVVVGAEAGREARLRLEDGSEVALPLTAIRTARLVLTEALIDASRPKRAADDTN
ncbi:MAG: ribosome maturation factor RimP [Elioraea sp.]|nr:ribosome maturation factor RimP [Elioraea sp.]